ncbi:uncharacterized protein DS421_12g365840 [Arachis hypogaea]|nr:uncharacterized protein DS421_12g365840 [Arachis hypogaea]
MTKTKFFIIDSARIHCCLDLVGRDKKKEFAPTNAAFYSLGADLFLSQLKTEHIARCLGVPSISIPGDVPSILIVNIQIQLYPATVFQTVPTREQSHKFNFFKALPFAPQDSKKLVNFCYVC